MSERNTRNTLGSWKTGNYTFQGFGKGKSTEELIDELTETNLVDPLQVEIDSKYTEPDVRTQTFEQDEVVAIAKGNLNFLAALCQPDTFTCMFPKVHLAIWSFLLSRVDLIRDFSRLALGIPRGFAKTTIVKLFIIYVILFTKKKFVLVIGNTAMHAENIIKDVMTMLEHPNMKATFGDWRSGRDTDNNTVKKFTFRGRTIILVALGQGGSLRGLNLNNARPDLMIFDDIQSKEDSESPVVSDAILTWMIGTAMKARDPKGCLYIFCANMYPGPNSILKKLKNNPTWLKFIAGAILEDGTSLWEELFPLEVLLQDMDNDISLGHSEIFFSEMLNDTDVSLNSKVDFSKIISWPYTTADLPQGKFILIDPSTNKIQSDLTAIGYFEIYDGKPALVRLVTDRLSPGNTIRKAILLALQTNTKVIAVEAISYQATLLYWFGVIAEQLGLEGFVFCEVYGNTRSKNSRIATMLKSLMASEILLHGSIRADVVSEISNWNPLKRDNVDNILDLLAYAPKVVELYGPECVTDIQLVLSDAATTGVVEDNHAF